MLTSRCNKSWPNFFLTFLKKLNTIFEIFSQWCLMLCSWRLVWKNNILELFWLKCLARFVSLSLIIKKINAWSKEIFCFDTAFNNDNSQHTDYFQTNPLIFWQLQLQNYICWFKFSKTRFRTRLTKTCSMLIKKKVKKC